MTRSGGGGMWEWSFGCAIFYVGQCVLREWVVGGSGLDGYFGERGQPLGIQEYLEGFHRGCFEYLSRQVAPKWDSPNDESELATAGTTSLLVELIGVEA